MKSAFTVVLFVLCGLFESSAMAQVLSIGSETIESGGAASVALDISGLGNGSALGAFDVNVDFNPAVLNFTSATYGDPTLGDQLNLEGFGTLSSTTPGAGTAELFELSFDSPSALTSSQPTSFTLATLTFNAISDGVSNLMLSVNALADEVGNSLNSTVKNGSITVESSSGGGGTLAAPEIDPASAISALTLLLGGLAVLRGRWVSENKPSDR